jgi:hypothetical protein
MTPLAVVAGRLDIQAMEAMELRMVQRMQQAD